MKNQLSKWSKILLAFTLITNLFAFTATAATKPTASPKKVVKPAATKKPKATLKPILIPVASAKPAATPEPATILNVSYDPTRELYDEYNKAFADYWQKKTGQVVTVKQSHGGSGKQARSVIDGLNADVVTLALAADIDAIVKKGLIAPSWEQRNLKASSPYTSTIVFVVRKGNPKKIKDWNDLIKSGVEVITPNPKTSGGARWNFLAAWAYFENLFKGNEEDTRDAIAKLYKNVKVLDSGARASTTTFVENKIGDVYISWENEAFLIRKEFGNDYEIVTPSISILAEPSVSVVDRNTDKNGTRNIANAYLQYLYSSKGQEIVAKNFYRPIDIDVAKKFDIQFPKLKLVTIRDFGGWTAAQKKYFADNAIFDQIYAK